jgi:hypothetical protein
MSRFGHVRGLTPALSRTATAPIGNRLNHATRVRSRHVRGLTADMSEGDDRR